MSNYRLGVAFERRTKTLLESMGYLVIRSAGSHGIADLVAIRADTVLLVQCKRRGVISQEELNSLYDCAHKVGCKPVVAQMRGARGTALYLVTGRKEKRGAYPYELLTMD